MVEGWLARDEPLPMRRLTNEVKLAAENDSANRDELKRVGGRAEKWLLELTHTIDGNA